MLQERNAKLWWYPPQPPFFITSRPSFSYAMDAPQVLACSVDLPPWFLAGQGPYIKMCSTKLLASEYLQYSGSTGCTWEVIAWSWHKILEGPTKQTKLSRGFCLASSLQRKPVSLSYWGRGIKTILTEQHVEQCLAKMMLDLTSCQLLWRASTTGLIVPMMFYEPSKASYIHCITRDIWHEITDIKTFGMK